MATYAVGDVQGCYRSLQALLHKIGYHPQKDRILLAGDLVNRGPGSLEVLRWALEQGESLVAVLGNHDLHLLAVALGAARPKGKDTLDPILEAPDADLLLAWLRARPLVVHEGEFAMVHAGVYPAFTSERALSLAHEIEHALRGDDAKSFFEHMYGGQPERWSDELHGFDRLRFLTNVFTRMRMVHLDGRLELRWKGGPQNAPPDVVPWFDAPRRAAERTVIFGHWSALGLYARPDVIGLDTGCVWGGALSAVRLEDRKFFQVDALDGALPIDE